MYIFNLSNTSYTNKVKHFRNYINLNTRNKYREMLFKLIDYYKIRKALSKFSISLLLFLIPSVL